MKSELSRFIEGDLDEIADYIAQDSPLNAVSLIRAIRSKFGLIAANPFLYQLREEIGDHVRLAVVGRYVILFRIAADVVRIERVVFGGRELNVLVG